MIYIPDSYDYKAISEKFSSLDEFYGWQRIYKKYVESYLMKLLKLNEVEEFIGKSNVQIPQVADEEYNFYHNSEVFMSGYLSLRNNIHLEKLSEADLMKLKSSSVKEDFIATTLEQVLYEDGDMTLMGPAVASSAVKSKSVVIEFSYNQKAVATIEELKEIEQVINQSFDMIQANAAEVQIPVSTKVYKAIPDLFFEEEKQQIIL